MKNTPIKQETRSYQCKSVVCRNSITLPYNCQSALHNVFFQLMSVTEIHKSNYKPIVDINYLFIHKGHKLKLQ